MTFYAFKQPRPSKSIISELRWLYGSIFFENNQNILSKCPREMHLDEFPGQ